jgi:cobalt-precorrin-5B (C1)-methyltransferase
VLAGQFAKLLKVACGHGQTHVAASSLDLAELARWVESEVQDRELASIVREANTARQVLEESGNSAPLAALVGRKARDTANRLAPTVEVKVLVAGYRGEVLYFR